MMQLPNGSGHGDGRKKKSKTREDGSYQTAGHGDRRKRKARLKKMVAVPCSSGWLWRQRKKEEQTMDWI